MRARAIDQRTHTLEVVAFLVAVGLVAASMSPFHANQTLTRPPVIDMRAHFTAENGPRIMDALNIRYVLPAGDREGFAKLKTMVARNLPAVAFPCPGGRELFFGRFACLRLLSPPYTVLRFT